jgi:hypothetical protein
MPFPSDANVVIEQPEALHASHLFCERPDIMERCMAHDGNDYPKFNRMGL